MYQYPILLIVIGAVVLMFGKRLSVLGAAVGAMLGVRLLQFFSADPWFQFGFVLVLSGVGFFLAGLAKGIVNIVLVVLCALAGAGIALGFIDLFNLELGWFEWVVALVGGLVGWLVYGRFSEAALIILAGLIGGLLITRGLTIWLPDLLGGALGTLLVIVLAGAGIGSQSGYFAKRQAASEAQAAAAAAPVTTAAPVTAAGPVTPEAPVQVDGGNAGVHTTPPSSE